MSDGGTRAERVASLRAEFIAAVPERRAQILIELERLGEKSTVVAPDKESR